MDNTTIISQYNSSPLGRLGGAIYIHIPFCKQACHYCDFHFSTTLKKKDEMIQALAREIELRKSELSGQTVETIYFGGGTPSLLSIKDLQLITNNLKEHYLINNNAELTLEANPDDITEEKLIGWKNCGINRLSIGIQSFNEEELVWMNRAHNATQAINNLQLALQYFNNISVDLIYGTPLLTNKQWLQNLQTVAALNIPHISCYALTVEPKTVLHTLIQKNKLPNVDVEKQAQHFEILTNTLAKAHYEHYEISNFAKTGFRSKHNSSYWQGKHYL